MPAAGGAIGGARQRQAEEGCRGSNLIKIGSHECRKAAARAHGNELFPCPMNSDEGGAPVILWLRKEAG
jgi:hypothetical protein